MKDELRAVDELNLAEWPLGLLSDRIPPGVNSLTFEGRAGRLIITGAEGVGGLPVPLDTDVLMGLLHISKSKNNCTSPKVEFSRYELAEVLGMPHSGATYKRLSESLSKWVGVTLKFVGVFYDNALKCEVDATFHILDEVSIFTPATRAKLRSQDQAVPPSYFRWSERFFESFRVNNLKQLDLAVYLRLGSAVSKRIYRYIDKNMYKKHKMEVELGDFVFNHIGMSKSYALSKAKAKLAPALAELVGVGFLNSFDFEKTGRTWVVKLGK